VGSLQGTITEGPVPISRSSACRSLKAPKFVSYQCLTRA
jgi:hypothetical protein